MPSPIHGTVIVCDPDGNRGVFVTELTPLGRLGIRVSGFHPPFALMRDSLAQPPSICHKRSVRSDRLVLTCAGKFSRRNACLLRNIVATITWKKMNN